LTDIDPLADIEIMVEGASRVLAKERKGVMTMYDGRKDARALREEWAVESRWNGVHRDYSAEDVVRLRGTIEVKHTFA
jgi:hypothetical protein